MEQLCCPTHKPHHVCYEVLSHATHHNVCLFVCFTCVLVQRHVCIFVGTECEQLVSKEQVFDYFIRHNDSENALRFIMSRVPPLGNPSPCPTQIACLCSHIPQSVEHLRDSILDNLARYCAPHLIHVHTLQKVLETGKAQPKQKGVETLGFRTRIRCTPELYIVHQHSMYAAQLDVSRTQKLGNMVHVQHAVNACMYLVVSSVVVHFRFRKQLSDELPRITNFKSQLSDKLINAK